MNDLRALTVATGPVRCTYRYCDQMFATEKDMKRHKKYEPQHHYCRICDYDAIDWDDLLDHKIETMAPWLIGEKRHEEHKHFLHLVCEFCGEDFKSMEGRMAHRRQMHQATQEVVCQGNGPIWDVVQDQMVHGYCGQVFMRASDLIHHYERDKCQFVTASQFHAERQHKHVLKQILQDPEMFCNNMFATQALRDGDAMSSRASTVHDTDDETVSSVSGGVALLDFDDTSQLSGYQSLKPRSEGINLLDQVVDDRIGPQKHPGPAPAWPIPLSPYETQYIRDAATRMGASQTPPSYPPTEYSDSGSSAATLHPPTSSSLTSYIATLQASPLYRIDWAALSSLPAAPAADKSNLFHSPWYLPSSPSYSPSLFYHPLLDSYKCPFASCGAEFAHHDAMEAHLARAHVVPPTACPSCARAFATVSALLRHFEASVRGSRCWIARARDFAMVLAEVTGGFVEVRTERAEGKLAGVEWGDGGWRVERRGEVEGDGVRSVVMRGVEMGKWRGGDGEEQGRQVKAIEGAEGGW